MYPYLSSEQGISAGAAVALAREKESPPDASPLLAEAAESAKRELELTLQLLANRAQSLTHASAATIGLADTGPFHSRASAGAMATEAGSELRTDPALISKCLEKKQIVCCNDTRNGSRSDGTKYEALAIKSMMVMPLLREEEAVGLFELLSDRKQAFDDTHAEHLERLAGMVLIALDHSNAAKRAFDEIAEIADPKPIAESPAAPSPIISQEPVAAVPAAPAPPKISEKAAETGEAPTTQSKVQVCSACGFPVSDGRALCVDCEQTQEIAPDNGVSPAFLSQLAREGKQSWLQEHFYTIGTVLMILMTVLALMLKFR